MGADAQRGNVELIDVIFQHAPHAERRRHATDGVLHGRHPTVRYAVQSAVVIRWHNLAFEKVVERGGVGGVAGILVGIVARLADGPAIMAVVSLFPPAVYDTAIGQAVEAGLLAARAARLVRANGGIEPHIAAGDEMARHIYVVIVEEDD